MMNIKLLLIFILLHFSFIKNEAEYKGIGIFSADKYICFSNNETEINVINIDTHSIAFMYNVSIINIDTYEINRNLTTDNSGSIMKKIYVDPGFWNICIISNINDLPINYDIYMYNNDMAQNIMVFLMIIVFYVLFAFSGFLVYIICTNIIFCFKKIKENKNNTKRYIQEELNTVQVQPNLQPNIQGNNSYIENYFTKEDYHNSNTLGSTFINYANNYEIY